MFRTISIHLREQTMKSETELLEQILTAEVLILSHLMDAQRREKGITRMGADYRDDAIREIRQARSSVIQKLVSES